MIIQFNTDKTISGDEANSAYFTTIISERLERFSDHISRVEVHLSDENGNKNGVKDIRCIMEVRIEGSQPIAATHQDNTVEQAISGAIGKLKSMLESKKGRLEN